MFVKNRKKWIIKSVILTVLIVPAIMLAGNLEPTAGPSDQTSAMPTLKNLYDRLDIGTAIDPSSSGFTGPASGPGDSGPTLSEIISKMPAINDATGLTREQVPCGTHFWSLRSDQWGTQEGLIGATTWYLDSDNDSYGDTNKFITACSQPSSYVADNTDCNDDNIDVHPGATDICEDGIDNDCDGSDSTLTTWYRDSDNDSFGNAGNSTTACAQPSGYVSDNTDCNDSKASVYPGRTETCENGIDDNCNSSDNDTACLRCKLGDYSQGLNVTLYRGSECGSDGGMLLAQGDYVNEGENYSVRYMGCKAYTMDSTQCVDYASGEWESGY